MKPLFLDCPPAWTRTKSLDQTPADYACSVQRTGGSETRGDLAVKWVVRFGFVFVACLLAMEKFA
jgi:hypothetical protein